MEYIMRVGSKDYSLSFEMIENEEKKIDLEKRFFKEYATLENEQMILDIDKFFDKEIINTTNQNDKKKELCQTLLMICETIEFYVKTILHSFGFKDMNEYEQLKSLFEQTKFANILKSPSPDFYEFYINLLKDLKKILPLYEETFTYCSSKEAKRRS